MMKNYDQSVEINIIQIGLIFLTILIGGSGSRKTNALLNLIKHQQPDIDKKYLYVKEQLESKYQLLIKGRGEVGIENLKNPKAFIDYLQTIDDVYENLEDYNHSS